MKATAHPLVSIVTPFYNEAEHLPECIESVLAQTYANWDYTLVNNCSTDGSDEIARRYAAKDPRIRVHDNRQLLRAFPNHNEAMRQISPGSKYCKVVFADDWIFPECLERMVALAESNPSVGIVSAYALEGTKVTCGGLPYPGGRVPGRELCRRHLLEGLYCFGSANTVLFRSDLVRSRDPFFNEADIHADTDSCFALLRMTDFGFVNQVLTFTRVRPESLTPVATDLQASFPSMLRLLRSYGPECLDTSELSDCMKRCLSGYYHFLGKSLLLRRDESFWTFHKTKMQEAGVSFSRARVLWEALKVLCNAVLSPREYVAKLVKRNRIPDVRLSSRFSIHRQEIQ